MWQDKMIFLPAKIAQLELKNRIVMSPMVANCASEDGSVTPEFSDFYVARARGGVGLIIVGATYVHKDGRGYNGQLGIYDDTLLPGLSDFCQRIHEYCKVFVQLSLRFRERAPADFSYDDIRMYVRAFVEGALRARQSGFDGVELHACHDYFLNQFLSPYTNKRTDWYGGSIDGRMRLLVETLRGVREAVGDDYIIGCRISADEFVPGGIDIQQSKEVARRLELEGANYIHVSGGIGETQFRMIPPMEIPRGSLLPFACAIKEVVGLPVIGVGRLDRPSYVVEALSKGIDLVSLGRALIADSEFVNKMESGEEEHIRPCLSCNYCVWQLHQQRPIRCVVNPYVGRDLMEPPVASSMLNTIVVGGGPAGAQAAIVAAQRGHSVTLYEKNEKVGGKILVGKKPPHKEPLEDFVGYLNNELSRAGVNVVFGRTVEASEVVDANPDVVIVAVGSRPARPKIPGIESPAVCFAEELLMRDSITPGNYLVVGAGLVGLETAEFIVSNSKSSVLIVEMLEDVGKALPPMRLKLVLERLGAAGVTIMTKTKLVSIDGGNVVLETDGEQSSVGPVDVIVLAAGYRSDRSFAEAVIPLVKRCMEIGDCVEVRTIFEAIKEGFEAGLSC